MGLLNTVQVTTYLLALGSMRASIILPRTRSTFPTARFTGLRDGWIPLRRRASTPLLSYPSATVPGKDSPLEPLKEFPIDILWLECFLYRLEPLKEQPIKEKILYKVAVLRPHYASLSNFWLAIK